MLTFLNSLIGFSYDDNPVGYVLCFMLVCWMLYLMIQFLYSLLGLNRK